MGFNSGFKGLNSRDLYFTEHCFLGQKDGSSEAEARVQLLSAFCSLVRSKVWSGDCFHLM